MTLGALSSPRPALAVGFLASLSWVDLCAQGLLDAVPLPCEIKRLIGICTPVLAVSGLLHRSALFSSDWQVVFLRYPLRHALQAFGKKWFTGFIRPGRRGD